MANFWFKFEWDAWRNDKQLRRCSKETRGFWIDCIALMEEQQTFFIQGTPAEICRDVVAERGEFDRSIAELTRTGAATVEKCQEVVKLVSRRLLKKLNLTEYNRLKQQESRAGIVSRSGQDPPSKDLDSQSLRALDSPIGEVQNIAAMVDPKILLPEDFNPSDEMKDWAKKEFPSLNTDLELDEFITFWRDIATKNNKRTMRGWNATWKNRLRELQRKTPSGFRPNGSKPKPVDVGKYDPATEQPFEPDPPCRFCGKDMCLADHRAELLAEQQEAA